MKTLALKFIIIIAVKDHGANSFESRGHLGLHCQTKKKWTMHIALEFHSGKL